MPLHFLLLLLSFCSLNITDHYLIDVAGQYKVNNINFTISENSGNIVISERESYFFVGNYSNTKAIYQNIREDRYYGFILDYSKANFSPAETFLLRTAPATEIKDIDFNNARFFATKVNEIPIKP